MRLKPDVSAYKSLSLHLSGKGAGFSDEIETATSQNDH